MINVSEIEMVIEIEDAFRLSYAKALPTAKPLHRLIFVAGCKAVRGHFSCIF